VNLASVPKDFRPLAKAAVRQGWRVSKARRGGHLHWVSPSGALVVSSVSPGTPGGLHHHRRLLRAAGLDT
jgi:hypothetical protein